MNAYFWNNVDNRWLEQANWYSDPSHTTSLNRLPEAGDTAYVISGATVVFDDVITIDFPLVIPDGATLANASVSAAGNVTFSTGSSLTLGYSDQIFAISGIVNISASFDMSGGFFDVLNGGTLNISSGSTISHQNSTNDLTVRVASGGTFNVNGTYNNDSFIESSGVITVGASGILRIRTDANILEGGTITVADGGEISVGNIFISGPTLAYLLMSKNTSLTMNGKSKLVIYGDASFDIYPSATEGGTTNVINSPPFRPLNGWW